jgi:hypothetical protein
MKRKHKRLRFAGDADALHFQSAGHMMAGTYIEISFQTADTDAPWRDIRSVLPVSWITLNRVAVKRHTF